MECRCDLIGYFLTSEGRQRLRGRDFHRVVDGRGLHVEGASKDEREAEHIVDLVWIVGASGRNDGVRADGVHLFRRDFRVWVGHGEDDRPVGHRSYHFPADDPAGGKPEENVGARDHFGQRSRLGLLGKWLLPRVHQFVAALVDHAFDIGDGDVLALHSYPHEQIEAC